MYLPSDAQLPHDETSTISATVLDNLESDEDVADLRDTYAADLVQLHTNLDSPGRGLVYIRFTESLRDLVYFKHAKGSTRYDHKWVA